MTEKISELEKTIETHEKRILKLEKILLSQDVKAQQPKLNDKTDFRGLVGGIKFLISEGFLNAPKSVKEIQEELKKEGYHYSYDSADKLLRVDLVQKQKMLARIKEDKVWKYVVRK